MARISLATVCVGALLGAAAGCDDQNDPKGPVGAAKPVVQGPAKKPPAQSGKTPHERSHTRRDPIKKRADVLKHATD